MMKTATTDMRRHIRTRIKIDGDKRTHRLSRSVGMLSRYGYNRLQIGCKSLTYCT